MTKREPGVLKLPADFTIRRATELKAALLTALDAGNGPLELDLSAVDEIDTSGLQLLMLLKQTALARRRDLHLLDASTATRELLELVRLTAYFDVTPS